MKAGIFLLFTFLICVLDAESHPDWDLQIQDPDTASILPKDYQFYDDQIHDYDSLRNYRDALNAGLRGLALAKKNHETGKTATYHLKVAKYYYLTGRMDEAISHLRLYALLRESATESEKDQEMFELENAYLDEIEQLMNEMDLDKTLINNLREENESYYKTNKTIKNAMIIGLIALFLVFSIIGYNRYRTRKNKSTDKEQETDDIGKLHDQVEKLEQELKRNTHELERLRESQQNNLTYARNIQLSLLPTGIDLSEIITNSFVIYIPRSIISGDFYAVFQSNAKSIVAIFDCPGHGVNAAHSTVVTHNLFKELVEQGITAPSMILTMLDQKLKHEIQQLDTRKELLSGVKMAVCTIDNQTKELEYAGARFPLFYVHLDELHFVRGNRFPIGDPLFSDKFYSSSNLRLSTGDMVYMSTDGFYSQLGGKKNKKFLRTSMISLLNTVYKQEINEQKLILEKVFQEWKSHNEQTDDVLVMGFRL